jgi:alpha/beta superfamily hydrolase
MTGEAARTTKGTLQTADGVTLVSEETIPAGGAIGGASIAHPHPQYGGTMHDMVAMTLDRALVMVGVATVRFAFRGAGGSGGTHGGGSDERLDVLAALERGASLAPGGPLLACGYSFGADVTLATDHPAVTAWVAVAPPLRMFDDFSAAFDARPKHLFVGEHDQFNPPEAARASTAGWANTTVHVVESADHFFHGAHDRLRREVAATLSTLTVS